MVHIYPLSYSNYAFHVAYNLSVYLAFGILLILSKLAL